MRVVIAVCLASVAFAQQPAPLHLTAAVQDKNFYLLSLIERDKSARRAIETDPVLAAIATAKGESLAKAAKSCGLELLCYATATKWTDAEIGSAGNALRGLYTENVAVKQMVDGPLRASGVLVRYHGKPGADLLAQGFEDAARGINNAIEVYGTGRAPRYPEIDSVSFDVKQDSYRRLVQTIAAVLEDDKTSMDLFFEPSLRFALALMDANHRDEAGRLEPLESGENAASVKRIPSVEWSRFPYSVIVVPGSGNDRPSWSLSPYGKLRVMLAAKRFREGKAPFILVSGGFVHPSQTPYCEAIEMKKSLMADFGIPEDAILVEPHARHTTTNIRNAVREIYRSGIPFDKKALITTDPGQSSSIESPAFARRCITEMGYEPQRLLGRISQFDLEFLPRIESLQMDPADLLDP
jgi:hypothetical protein